MFESYDDIVDVETLCEMVKIGKSKAYRLVATKKIKAFKEQKDWRIPKQAVVEYVFERSGMNICNM